MSIRTTRLRWSAIGLAALVVAGCATGSSAKHGAAAAKRGEWDAAVAYYRQALDSDPKKIELQIELERATRQASAQHLARGKELETQDQLPAAAAEYRRAIEFDPSNSLALTRALDVERRIRDQIDANRPLSRMDQLRAQAQAASPIPRLDPRAPLPSVSFNNMAIRDALGAISRATGIGIQYDQGLEGTIGKPVTLDLTGHNLESAFNFILSQNTLAYKILDPKTIFIYADNAGNRAKYEDQYQQTFYLSHGDVAEVSQILNQMLTTTTATNRPVVTQNKAANAIVVRASAPMLGLIKNIIDSADKPRAEVLIEVTILEVSRTSLKNLGLDLSTYAITLSFSPGGPPPAAGGVVGQPDPVAVGGLNQFNKGNLYAALPNAVINILESDQKTKLLAKPQLRGREGDQLLLNLGQDVPIVTTTFQSVATGGVPTVPQSSYTFRPIGVNLSITTKVTLNDEIILSPITVDKSAIGPNVLTGGQSLQSFIKRTATVSMRLRDGESNLLAGLVLQEDRETARSVPGILHIPVLRSIFGNTDSSNDQSDVVMIVTPHIVRSREITEEDLKPFYVGTSNNLGAATAPGLISQAPPPGSVPPPGTPVPTPTPTPTPNPATGTQPPTRPTGAVAIEPVNPAPTTPPAGGATQILMTVPAAELQMGGQPYLMPISIQNVSNLGAATLTVTYDPKVLKATGVSQGTLMSQGGVTPTFVPKIDEAAGRIDIAITRGGTNPGANGTNMLAAVTFQAIGAGTSKVTVTGSAMTPDSKPIQLQLPAPGTVVVK
ncbi:MAG TPA: cohesin domain-containing protein [Vicinamibacterales bacterium]|nr:cohesin domain-containing protein [Vicinamibacterales bacterium]